MRMVKTDDRKREPAQFKTTLTSTPHNRTGDMSRNEPSSHIGTGTGPAYQRFDEDDKYIMITLFYCLLYTIQCSIYGFLTGFIKRLEMADL
jgi:hypothetical protein